MLSPFFRERAISLEKNRFWSKKLIFHIYQGKQKFRSFQRFSCNFHLRAQNAFQSWKNAIFSLNAKYIEPSETVLTEYDWGELQLLI